MPRSRVGIFCNKHTRSTPLDPKLTFLCVLYYLGSFGTIWLPYETRSKTVRTSAKVRARSRVRIFRNECPGSNSLDHKLTFWCVLYHFGAFGTVKFGAIRAELVQKFVPRSRVGIFRNKRTRSNPLDPKLTFWCVSYYLGAFGTIWLP